MINKCPVFKRFSVGFPWLQPQLAFYCLGLMACGYSTGIIGLIALTSKPERWWLVSLPLVAGVFVIVFSLGEVLVPHQVKQITSRTAVSKKASQKADVNVTAKINSTKEDLIYE